MRMIGVLPDQMQAQRLGDYLQTLGIDNTMEEGLNGWSVWVHDDDHVPQAATELEQFRQTPLDQRYDVGGQAAGLRHQQQQRQHRMRENFHDVRTRWANPNQWNVPLTLILIVLCAAVALMTRLGSSDSLTVRNWLQISSTVVFQDEAGLHLGYRLGLPEVRQGQAWRLITPIFLHFGIIHLLFNLLWLRDLGGMIEHFRGTALLALLVVVSGVTGNLAEYMWSGPTFGGMSGVVYGMFGYVWIKGKYEPWQPLQLNPTVITIMLGWLIVCMTGLLGPIANAAHLGGLVAGAAMAGGPIAWRRLRAA